MKRAKQRLEIAAILDVMDRHVTSMAQGPINVFEHLKAHLLQFVIFTIDDFIEVIIGSSPILMRRDWDLPTGAFCRWKRHTNT